MKRGIAEREKTAREIAKTRASIRRKHRALKTGRMEEEVALEKQFKPIVEPLKRIVEHTGRKDIALPDGNETRLKDSYDDDDEIAPSPIPRRLKKRRLEATSDSPLPLTPVVSTPIEASKAYPLEEEEVFETKSDDSSPSFGTFVRQTLRTPQGREALHSQLGPLGRRYVSALFSGDKKSEIDIVYGVYVSENRTMLGDKQFDLEADDSMIIDGIRYAGTPGLYELIFKRLPDDAIYTKDDLKKYKSILLATNAYRRGHSALMPIMGNKGYKYKHVIAPLIKKSGGGVLKPPFATIPSVMKVTNKKVDYVHWDDPNELVDRLRLLDASHRAGNDAHDNEILSILEELREAGIIIN